MLEDEYLERLGIRIRAFEKESDTNFQHGEFIQQQYMKLLKEQERDLRDYHNGKGE